MTGTADSKSNARPTMHVGPIDYGDLTARIMANKNEVSIEERKLDVDIANQRLESVAAVWLDHRTLGVVKREIDDMLTQAIDDARHAEQRLQKTQRRLEKRATLRREQ